MDETMSTYEHRYCAYVDILGFRELVIGLRNGSVRFEMLRDLLLTFHAPQKGSTKSWDTDFRAQSISDAVAISTSVNSIGLFEVFNALEVLTLELLKHGYFARGALVKGMLYHDERMVLGEALVRASDIETNIVRYPRIMVTREIVEDLAKYAEIESENVTTNRLLQAEDGPWFVNVLGRVAGNVYRTQIDNINRPPSQRTQLAEYATLQDMIQKRLDESAHNPSHFDKVQWFANYWNSSFPYGIKDFKKITGPGLGRMAWFAEAR